MSRAPARPDTRAALSDLYKESGGSRTVRPLGTPVLCPDCGLIVRSADKHFGKQEL